MSVSGPPKVICNSLAVGLCILVLAQMPGQGELDSIENCALANAVRAVEYREVFGEIEPHPLPVSAENAQGHVGEVHGDSASTWLTIASTAVGRNATTEIGGTSGREGEWQDVWRTGGGG